MTILRNNNNPPTNYTPLYFLLSGTLEIWATVRTEVEVDEQQSYLRDPVKVKKTIEQEVLVHTLVPGDAFGYSDLIQAVVSLNCSHFVGTRIPGRHQGWRRGGRTPRGAQARRSPRAV